jgi:protein SCO1/2
MKTRIAIPSSLVLLAALAACTGRQESCCKPADAAEVVSASAASESPLAPSIPDVVLIDQDGRERRFYSDLLRGKLVLVNAIYTRCAGTCPMQSSIFSSVQRHLKERMGREVVLLSISLEPLTDRPAKLKEFAERYRAGPGWTFLTGSRENVKTALEAMDLYSAVPEEHTPICVVGNERTGVWMKLVNLASPYEIVDRIDYVAGLDPRALVAR